MLPRQRMIAAGMALGTTVYGAYVLQLTFGHHHDHKARLKEEKEREARAAAAEAAERAKSNSV